MKRAFVAAVVCICLILPCAVRADNDARDYIPAPPGTLAILTYYKYITGNTLYQDGKKISNDYNFSENLGMFRVVYYMMMGPIEIDPQFIIPFANFSIDGKAVGNDELSASGIGDPMVFATFWFINNKESKTWLGFTPFITIPGGNYESDRGGLNIGNNRWAFKPELGFVKGIGDRTYFEITLAGEFYTDNDDYIGKTLSQDPVLTVESHLSYDLTKSLYASLDYFYHNGGEQSIAGINQNNTKDDHALQLTMGYSFAPGFQLLLQYRNDFEVNSGPVTQTVGLRLLYAFDMLQACSGK